MPIFKVTIQATAVCMIEADTEEEALDFAHSDMDKGSFEINESIVAGPITDEAEIDRLERHADFKSLA